MMKNLKFVNVLFVLMMGLVGLAPGVAAAQEPGRRLFALLVIDTDAKISGLDEDERNIQALLGSQLPVGSVTTVVLRDNLVNAKAIGQAIDEIAGRMNRKTDVFLFYYSGHGATINGDHSLTLNCREILPRGVIRKRLLELEARLVVMLTDCCATSIVLKPEDPPTKTAPAPQAPAGGRPRVRVLEQLFFGHTGLVDLNSSSFDETSWSSSLEGGVFTKALARVAFQNDLEGLDQLPRDGFVAWDEFFAAVRGATIQSYQTFREGLLRDKQVPGDLRDKLQGQYEQRPYALSLAVRDQKAVVADLFAANLGIHYELVPIFGVKLKFDAPPGSVAAQRPLERDDMIVLLDNMPIFGPKDLRNHVARTSSVFVNVRTGLAESFVFQLPRQILPSNRDDFAPNFGIQFEPVPLFGARLTRDAPARSAAAQRPLERGDMIVLLDGTPIRSADDVLAHQAQTPAVFINIRSGQAERFVFQLPAR